MKTILILFIFISNFGLSQIQHFGFKLAPNIQETSIYLNNKIQQSSTSGLDAGLLLEIKTNGNISFLLEPSIGSSSTKYYNIPIGSTSEVLIIDKFTIVEIPLIWRYQFGGKVKFLADIGINSEFIFDFNQKTFDNSVDIDSKIHIENYSKMFAYNLGLGVGFTNKNNSQTSILLRRKSYFSGDNMTFNTQKISLAIQYTFPVSRK